MRAVLISDVTPAEKVTLTDVPIPAVKPGWVLVKIKAFGMNHSEQVLRLNEIRADYIKKPVVPGIECVGVVEDPSDSGWSRGQKVVALMGGMGRSFDGGYSEYALLPVRHVFPIESALPWSRLAAVPETYYTAWGSLFEGLRITSGDVLLVRGATCALGYAAIQLAGALGIRVVATARRESKLAFLDSADEALIDDGRLTGRIRGVTKALDLVGPKSLRDTLSAVEKGGVVCSVGILGGIVALNGFDPIRDIPNGVFLTGFFSNYPTPEAMREIFAFLDQHSLTPLVGATFAFEQIREACIALDSGKVNGKIVVTV